MTCAHCGRKLAGVATIFPEKPPVCVRADCLGWARDLALPRAAIVRPSFEAWSTDELRPAA
jgi:hypothetical protein